MSNKKICEGCKYRIELLTWDIQDKLFICMFCPRVMEQENG